MKAGLFFALASLVAVPGFAQLAPPNAMGVSIGHVHINATDVEAQKHFWAQVGGKIVERDKMTLVEFPGMFVPLRKQDPTGGPVGSTLNHFGIQVKDLPGALTKWKADGLTVMPVNNNPNQYFLIGPDAVRLEVIGNPSLTVPFEMHHIHLYVPDTLAAQKWYGDHFGGTPGKRLIFDTVNFPGAELSFSKSEMPQAATKGRTFDHMGFEVKGLDAFVAKLQAAGIKTDAPIRNSTLVNGLRIVYITDPWGTEIELTEGFAQ
jgi:catechol 2,3-dioxygenase-like lactoylglutathione lyase family enzyme